MSDNKIHLLAGQRPDGDLVYEDVAADAVGDGCYRLLSSPVFARGAAKGDIVRTMAAGRFEVEEHGGNLSIRVFARADMDTLQQRLKAPLEKIEAELEYTSDRVLVISVHVSKGFDVIEQAMNQAFQGREDAAWLYANVYDAMDGETPLNWWHDYLAK